MAGEELNATREVVKSATKSEWKLILKPGILKAVLIGVGIAILGQFMGVNAVLYYGPAIFESSGLSGGDSLFYQVMVGVVNMLTTVLALVIIDKVGRKQLVYYGVSGMILSLILIAFYFTMGENLGISSIFLLIFSCFIFLLCRIDLCCDLGIAFRNVSDKSTGNSDVYCRFFLVDRNLFDRSVNSLDVTASQSGRNIFIVCSYVRALYAYYLEAGSGNYR